MARLSAEGRNHVLAILQETASRYGESLPFEKPALRRVIVGADAWAEGTPAGLQTEEAFEATLSQEGQRLSATQRHRLYEEIRATRQGEGN